MSSVSERLTRFLIGLVTVFMMGLIIFSPVVASATPEDDQEESSSSSDEESESSGASADTIHGDGTANGTINVMLHLAKNSASDNAKSIDFDSLTKDEFQFLGVLMTNFYTPYTTELGAYKGYGDDDEAKEIEEKARENQKKSMTSILNITADDADVLLDFMIAASQETAKELSWGFSGKKNAKPSEITDAKGGTPVTLNQLQKMISGEWGMGSPLLSYKKEEIKMSGGLRGSTRWGEKFNPKSYVCSHKNGGIYTGKDLLDCWDSQYKKNKDDGHHKPTKDQDIAIGQEKPYSFLTYDGNPVFNVDMAVRETTPSVAALISASQIMDAERGIGTSFLEYTDSEEDEELLKKLSEDGKVPETDENSVLGMKLYIDAFGNIIAMGVSHQYVILPGAMNPYMWTPLNSDGEEDPDSPPGSSLSPMNSIMLGLANEGTLMSSSPSSMNSTVLGLADEVLGGRLGLANEGTSDVSGDTGTFNAKPINDLRKSLGGKDTEGNPKPRARVFRGSSETEINTKGKHGAFGWFGSEKSDFAEYIENIISSYTSTNTAEDGEHQKAVIDSPVLWGLEDDISSGIVMSWFGGHKVQMKSSEMPILNNLITIDKLGAFEGEEGFDGTFGTVKLLSGKGVSGDNGISMSDSETSKFTNQATDYEYGSQFSSEDLFGSGMDGFNNIYYSYAVASLDTSSDPELKSSQGELGYRLNYDYFPEVCSGSGTGIDSCDFELSEEQRDARSKSSADQQIEDIRNWIWYILNPVEGMNYLTMLIKNKTTSSVMGLHSDIVGTTGAPVVAGTTNYIGFSGYVTVPELSDLPWTDALIEGYNNNYFYIVVIIIVIMAAYAITGVLSLQRAVAGAVLFSFLAYTPAYLIDSTINISNKVTSGIYGEKFTYWALIQNQTYSDAIDEAATGEDYHNYLQTQMDEYRDIDITGTGNDSTNRGEDAVVVRWQSPKKMASLMFSSSPSNPDKAIADSPLFSNVLAKENNSSGESYVDADEMTYLFRSYIDINNFSRYIYRGIDNGNQDFRSNPDTSQWPSTLQDAWSSADSRFAQDVLDGYVNTNDGGSTNLSSGLRVSAPLSSNIVADTFNQVDLIDEGLTREDNLGIDTRSFNFSLPAFNSSDEEMMEAVKNTTSAFEQEDFDTTMGGLYTDEDYTGLAAYALMSESAFYYYSWSLYDQGMSTESGSEGGYKDLILQGKGSPYFYNVDGNNELKDYLDMKSLFTYVIPYLKSGNDVVRKFDDTYGLAYTPGVPTEEGHWDDEAIQSDPMMQQQYWKNLQVSKLYGIYSPWVDLMYEAKYAKAQDIDVQGDQVTIHNPLNPASYPSERPMVFSKAEQVDYGLNDGQLTTVERKIQSIQSKTQEGMFHLLNAYNFNDNVLNTAAGMEATFEFNKEFSETNLLGQNIDIYPQSYELKNFSYDAYLRLILANATGESVSGQSADAFYTSVVEDSSVFTAVVIIILDVLSVYVVPGFKIFLVLAIFISSVLMILTGALRIRDGVIKTAWKALIKPLLYLALLSITTGWIISLFMSNGNTGVTGYDGTSISLGDPVMTMLAMIAINMLLIYLMFLVSRTVWTNMIQSVKLLGSSMAGVAAGTVGIVRGISQGKGFREARASGTTRRGGETKAGTESSSIANERAEERASRGSSKVGKLSSGRTRKSAGDGKKDDRKTQRRRRRRDSSRFDRKKPVDNKETQDKKRKEIDEKAKGRQNPKASRFRKKESKRVRDSRKGTERVRSRDKEGASGSRDKRDDIDDKASGK